MDEPSGALMVKRTQKVKYRVLQVLIHHPQARGDDNILVYRYLRMYHPNVKLKFSVFEELLYLPAFETIRRRRQEWQEKGADGKPKFPELCPRERTVRKRKRRQDAMHDYFGSGLKLSDFEVE